MRLRAMINEVRDHGLPITWALVVAVGIGAAFTTGWVVGFHTGMDCGFKAGMAHPRRNFHNAGDKLDDSYPEDYPSDQWIVRSLRVY